MLDTVEHIEDLYDRQRRPSAAIRQSPARYRPST
ncbi:protein of unknown function (plasmid) [Azospirillum baldaniorum]|uniref:Uncharacterized protein n=1 Tax=Azospirillum baldaniorum TaxID=1064539 RepID=A0A9P1NR29_9PROT|nr:protein of unknown function [Azospirillum baldaniorum]